MTPAEPSGLLKLSVIPRGDLDIGGRADLARDKDGGIMRPYHPRLRTDEEVWLWKPDSGLILDSGVPFLPSEPVYKTLALGSLELWLFNSRGECLLIVEKENYLF